MNRVKNCVFLVRKWSYTTFNIVNKRKMWEKKGKIRRTRSMTKKKGHQKFLPSKWKFFLKLGREKFFWSLQIRRQVSAHGWMDGWMDGDGRTDGWTDRQTDRQPYR